MSDGGPADINGWEVLVIEESQDRDGQSRSFFHRVGRVNRNRDGSYNVYCAAWPAGTNKMQLRPPREKTDQQQRGGGQQQRGGRQQAPAQQQQQRQPAQQQQRGRQAPVADQSGFGPPPLGDDEIPF